MIDAIKKIMQPLKNRVLLMVGRGKLTTTKEDGIQIVNIDALAGETLEIERFQNFGFTSYAPQGTKMILVSVGGNREQAVVIACDDPNSRKKDLSEGESAIYDSNGKYMHLKTDGTQHSKLTKLKIENDSHEFVSLVVELLEELIASKNETAVGPLPKTADTIQKLTTLKTKFETFKV